MKPICVACHRFYRPEKNGVFFLEGMPRVGNPEPGQTEPENWEPYKLWCGDRWRCDGCGAVIIVGVGRERVAEHYEPDFADVVASYCGEAPFQVNDC